MTTTIHILPPALQSQIAAGEVLERPASAIKELVENSLDAGATVIDVTIDRGGQERILVQDNGQGIAEQELPLALTRHATSKIASMDDLLTISSFGFRGEALASIASVSRTLITSITPGAEQGAQIEVVHGKLGEIRPAALSRGTRIEVRDLFANVPVRLKFLKTMATEAKRCQETLAHLALAHLETSLSLTHNNREIFRFQGGETLQDRLQRIWPPSLMQGLVPIHHERGSMRITGLAGSPAQAQVRGNRIIFYVNGRPVKDKLLLHALRQGYKGTLLSKEYPQAVLFVELPANEVDVNVHPAKTEVRFMDEGAIFSLVQAGIRQGMEALLSETSAPAQTQSVREQTVDMTMPPPPARESDQVNLPSRNNTLYSEGAEHRPKFSSLHEAERLFSHHKRPERRPVSHVDHSVSHKETPPAPPLGSPAVVDQTRPSSGHSSSTHGYTYLGQFHRTYLILSKQNTLMLMDQHAAHERVLYHAFSTTGQQGEHQRLAIPQEMPLHPSEQEVVEAIWTDLSQIGFTLERPTPATLVIRAIPTSLATGEALNYLRTVLGEQTNNMDALWTTLACKSAIKAGHVLAYDEAMHLVETWLQCPDNQYCPHGRPVMLTWTVQELEKRFKRKP